MTSTLDNEGAADIVPLSSHKAFDTIFRSVLIIRLLWYGLDSRTVRCMEKLVVRLKEVWPAVQSPTGSQNWWCPSKESWDQYCFLSPLMVYMTGECSLRKAADTKPGSGTCWRADCCSEGLREAGNWTDGLCDSQIRDSSPSCMFPHDPQSICPSAYITPHSVLTVSCAKDLPSQGQHHWWGVILHLEH